MTATLLAIDTLQLTLRAGLTLALITAFITLATRYTRNHQTNHAQPRITIQHQQKLSKHTTVTLLSTNTTTLLIAHNQHDTTLLTQTPNAAATSPTAGNTTSRAEATSNSSTDGSQINLTAKPRANPIKTLQNKTLRRA